MSEPTVPLRADLRDIEPYVSPQLPARYRMNTNESPYPPPEALVREVTEQLVRTEFNRYPDRDARALHRALAEHTGWPEEGIWVANGSNEIFLHLFLSFGGPGRTALTFEPTYPLHTLIPRIAGTAVEHAQRDSGTWIARYPTATPDVTIFCSPNNPTGNIEDWAAIEEALKVSALVIVDEAYIEFAPPGSSYQDRLAEHPNLVITRTFSKAWSLAGARLGYLLADPEIVRSMQRVRLPYSISAFSQLIGVAALRHEQEAEQRIEAIRTERDRLLGGLRDIGVPVHDSAANFVLFEVNEPGSDPGDTHAVWSAFLEREVLIRNYSSVPALSHCLRVTAGLPEETDAFLRTAKEVL